MDINALFGLRKGGFTAIVGCGGKTSLMYLLAKKNSNSSVLIGTTTRIFTPPPGVYDRIVMPGDFLRREAGVALGFNGEQDGKLLPFPSGELDRVRRFFDYTVFECDGSKNLPLKGWADYEPVVPGFSDVTIGVVSPHPIGEKISRENTHRPGEFCAITGANPGDTVTPRHIASMVFHPRGMMQKAKGAKVLLINRVEDKACEKYAGDILSEMPQSFLNSLSLIITGSVLEEKFKNLSS